MIHLIFALCTASMSTILSIRSPVNSPEKLTLIIFSKPTVGKLSGITETIRYSSREGCT